MAGIVNDDGIGDFLEDLKVGANFSAMVCRLYSNNHVPAVTDTLANYTEATFAGYANVAVTGWSGVVVAGHVASTTSATLTFTLTSGTQNIYGAYFTDPGNTELYGAQEDPNAPVTLNTTVSVYTVTVTFTLQSA
jgi:hypothetical protein